MTGDKALLKDYVGEAMSGEEANLLPIDLMEFMDAGEGGVLVTAHLNWEVPAGADFASLEQYFRNHYDVDEVLDFDGVLHMEWTSTFNEMMTFEEFTDTFHAFVPQPRDAAEFLKDGGIDEVLGES